MDMEDEFEIDLDIRFQKGLRRLKMKKINSLNIANTHNLPIIFDGALCVTSWK